MVSYSQLEDEPWWDRETVTNEHHWLGEELCRRTNQPPGAFGTKGNNAHLNGGHRSQEWIKNSIYCNNRLYTVQSGLTAEQLRVIAASDFTPGVWGTPTNRLLMRQQTGRLVDAAKSGRLRGITQVEGTLDGVVTYGLNVASGSTFRPDSSHLEHWHLTYDRRFMHDMGLMQIIVEVALGTGMANMFCRYGDTSENVQAMQYQLLQLDPNCLPTFGPDKGFGKETQDALSRLVTGGQPIYYGPKEWSDMQKICAEKAGGGSGGGSLPDTVQVSGPVNGTVSGAVSGAFSGTVSGTMTVQK